MRRDDMLARFHPLVARWFGARFGEPTEPQRRGWPAIASGEHTLIAAPTGSGKTLAAFLFATDRLIRSRLKGELADETRVVYVSPLRALSNDMQRNLQAPLAELGDLALRQGLVSGKDLPLLRVGVRTGDTSSSRRAAMLRKPPHILVTTPESLYLLVTAQKARQTLRTVDTLIVDEIHALLGDKRGSHLSLTIERLAELTGRRVQRIGLSATQKPIERVARFLIGAGERDDACRIVDAGHLREVDLGIETPQSPLGAVCMHEQWSEVHERLVELIRTHRSTLIFVNTRRLAERLTHQLTERLGEGVVSSHHGSLAAALRLETEQALKSGRLKAVVATSSLELGIDVGSIDLVIQIGSPRSIAAFLQRIGRSGHSLGQTPKGRLFALTRDELLECMALVRAVRQGELETVEVPQAPLDVLAQQIVAEVACGERRLDELFALVRRADPYRDLSREDFDAVIAMLAEGIGRHRRRRTAYLHWDRVNGRVRARPMARMAAIANAGAIPENAAYRVITEDGTLVGTLDEDFATETLAGTIFLLGNNSWRLLHVRRGEAVVADAHGAPPTIPFWRGEAPGRSVELSAALSRLRQDIADRVGDPVEAERSPAPPDRSQQRVADRREPDPRSDERSQTLLQVAQWLSQQTGASLSAAQQAVGYVAAQKAAIGVVPTQRAVVFERFFDETGGMQLVVHAPFGARINKAWGLALRKRFCRSFDFELQATADDNGFVLSLGPQHSFPIESLFPMLTTANVRRLLEQALLAVPTFHIRWRWNATRALLVLRRQGGRRVPPNLQRFRAEDLLTAVFPTITGCLENVTGDIPLPDHPLVRQTMHDCLTEAVDLPRLIDVLQRIETGRIRVIAKDTRQPSPFSVELLNANPYAFLDGGEIQERRTRAVGVPRAFQIDELTDLTWLSPQAIAQVVAEAAPLVRNADELHDLLLDRVVLPAESAAETWGPWFEELVQQRRATRLHVADRTDPHRTRVFWVAAEHLPSARALFPDGRFEPEIGVPAAAAGERTSSEASMAAVRGLLESSGPRTASQIAAELNLRESQVAAACEALEGEGILLRGRFCRPGAEPPAAPHSKHVGTPRTWPDADGDGTTSPTVNHRSARGDTAGSPSPSGEETQWCDRVLLARIHRLTVADLRSRVRPVERDVWWRFLLEHQGLRGSARRSGVQGVLETIAQLEGLDIPASVWETDILPQRVTGYRPQWLDELCLTGEVAWGRIVPPRTGGRNGPMRWTRLAPIALCLRSDVSWLTSAAVADRDDTAEALTSAAADILGVLTRQGAQFPSDLQRSTGLLPAQLDAALGELVARGLVTADGFAGLRQLIGGQPHRSAARSRARRRGGRLLPRLPQPVGRWSVWPPGRCGTAGHSSVRGDADAAPRSQPGDGRGSDALEQWAWLLLRRWGIVFRELLEKEPAAPPWWKLVRVYRRLEARGEICGGRFVLGVGGAQFATSDCVQKLRQIRDQLAEPASARAAIGGGAAGSVDNFARGATASLSVAAAANDVRPTSPIATASVPCADVTARRGQGDGSTTAPVRNQCAPVPPRSQWRRPRHERSGTAAVSEVRAWDTPVGDVLIVNGADPVNLVGVVTSGARIPASASARLVFVDGLPAAACEAGRIRWLRKDLPESLRLDIARRLGVSIETLAQTE